jgi:hypothetical protein
MASKNNYGRFTILTNSLAIEFSSDVDAVVWNVGMLLHKKTSHTISKKVDKNNEANLEVSVYLRERCNHLCRYLIRHCC